MFQKSVEIPCTGVVSISMQQGNENFFIIKKSNKEKKSHGGVVEKAVE